MASLDSLYDTLSAWRAEPEHLLAARRDAG